MNKNNWFIVLVQDLIAGILTAAFLKAIIKISPKTSLLIGLIIWIGDYELWIMRGWNIASTICEYAFKK